MPVAFTSRGALDGLPAAVPTVLFRIAQEALTNIERHAGASHIELALERTRSRGAPGRVLLTVADDGAGFDAQDVETHPQRGIGLRNMAERLDAIGGTLGISSTAAGTTVCASIELKD
jgi:two-component system NarL family sensor kinase